jgi:hypothetical protein
VKYCKKNGEKKFREIQEDKEFVKIHNVFGSLLAFCIGIRKFQKYKIKRLKWSMKIRRKLEIKI